MFLRVAVIAIAILCVSPVLAEQRVALLIGNQSYSKAVGPLINPHTDVRLIGDALRRIGFKVTTIKDAGYKKMDQAFKRHVQRVRRAGPDAVSFVYFTGHGVANPDTGENYIVPVDAQRADATLWENSIEQSGLINRLQKQASNATHFVVFDACRDELQLSGPLNKSLGKRKGMLAINDTSGMLIAYATSPGATASDGRPGGNPYARALAQELVKPGVEAVQMFRRVQLKVKAAIGQDPWLSFPALPAVFLGGKAQQSKEEQARREWEKVKTSGDPAQLRAFAKRFPGTIYQRVALLDADKLEENRTLSASSRSAATSQSKPSSQPSLALNEWQKIERSSDASRHRKFAERFLGTTYARLALDRAARLEKRNNATGAKSSLALAIEQRLLELDRRKKNGKANTNQRKKGTLLKGLGIWVEEYVYVRNGPRKALRIIKTDRDLTPKLAEHVKPGSDISSIGGIIPVRDLKHAQAQLGRVIAEGKREIVLVVQDRRNRKTTPLTWPLR